MRSKIVPCLSVMQHAHYRCISGFRVFSFLWKFNDWLDLGTNLHFKLCFIRQGEPRYYAISCFLCYTTPVSTKSKIYGSSRLCFRLWAIKNCPNLISHQLNHSLMALHTSQTLPIKQMACFHNQPELLNSHRDRLQMFSNDKGVQFIPNCQCSVGLPSNQAGAEPDSLHLIVFSY